MKPIESKRIGKIGEDLAKEYLKRKGFGVSKGFGSSPDLKVYKSLTARDTHPVMGFITCEVKTSESDSVHRPPKKQREGNDLLALVKIRKNTPKKVKFEIKFELLNSMINNLFKKQLTFNEWEVLEYGK